MEIKDRVLVVEDDKRISNFIKTVLEANNYDVIVAQTGAEAYSMVTSQCPDVVILDLGLPDMDGMKILQGVREWSAMPVIVVSARTHERDKVEALDAGADDYLTKPFHLAELNARIKSVIRRKQQDGELQLSLANLTIYPDKHSVYINGKEIVLNRKEFDLLYYFISNPNRLISKATLAESVWGDYIDQADNFDFIYSQVKNLRKKLKAAGAIPEIKAVYGFGYKMTDEE